MKDIIKQLKTLVLTFIMVSVCFALETVKSPEPPETLDSIQKDSS